MRSLTTICFGVALTAPCIAPAAPIAVPAPAAALDHIAISVRDPDRSADFYKRLFGFAEVRAPVPMARWLVMANGTMLHIVGNRRVRSVHSRWDHFALSCADMDALVARLDAGGIAWTNMAGEHARQVRSDGIQQIFIQDPDGYWIEINDAGKPK